MNPGPGQKAFIELSTFYHLTFYREHRCKTHGCCVGYKHLQYFRALPTAFYGRVSYVIAQASNPIRNLQPHKILFVNAR
ncbi:hypothetical protein Plhal304r1_c088g0170441 [Plasmopara halstedii]